MRIKVDHSIGDLADDLRGVAVRGARAMPGVVRRNTTQGNALARRFAQASSGPHGRLYFKRITSEMVSPLVGEFGPTGDVVGDAVGAGWRHGPPNTDLPRAADVQGPKLAKDAGDLLDGLFW